MTLTDPDDLSVEPQVLVVPAAPKPGERLPRGADELRRAVLGVDASPSIERGTQDPVPERRFTRVPPELVAEIEAFKRTVQDGSSAASAANPAALIGRDQAVAASSAGASSTDRTTREPAASAGRPAPLSSNDRRALPPFLITVHVYDENPQRRFVYLNGSKAREGELTRDGFFIEQVLADGAIVRYDDYRFFESP
jgi:general secretion pathway protein B